MEEKDIKTVKTTRGELRYYRDWGNYDGGVVMLNAQTIDRYKAIKNEHPDADKCRQTATHFILVHSAIEYFIHK